MANGILTAATPVKHTHQYQLDPKARQAILAQSDSAKTARLIEDQYTKFFEKNNGCPFGQEFEPKI